MFCPNLSINSKGEYNYPDVAEKFNKLKAALGEDIAYLVWHKNGGNYLDLNSKGKPSNLWKTLYRKYGEQEAIKKMSKIFSSNLSITKAPIEKIKYDYSKPASEQSREARDNAKLDIFLSVLTNPDTFVKGINPGNFQMLKDLANPKSRVANIATQRGESPNEGDIILPSTNREMFKRNMTGKALIGMFVNHAVNHAMIQYTNLEFTEPIELAGLSLSKLNSQKTIEEADFDSESLKGVKTNDLYISRALGMWVGASADTAKDPVAFTLNVSTFTADILSTLVRTGFSMETALYFLNQPALVELSEQFYREGSLEWKYQGIMNEIEAKYISKLKDDIIIPETKDISRRDLFLNIKPQDSQRHIAQQVAALRLFDSIRKKANALHNVVDMMRPDNLGRQVKLSTNEVFENNVKETIANTTELKNVGSVFSQYPLIKSFYDNAVLNTSKEMGNWFPYNKPMFKETRELIKQSLPENTKFTDKQIDFINLEFMGYLTSGFEFFDGTDREYIIKEFPKEFDALKPQFEEHPLIARLEVESEKANNIEVETIKFNSPNGLSEIDKDHIRNSWEELLNNPGTKSLAEKLIKYSFYTNMFYISPRSFTHLIPVGFFRSLNINGDPNKSFNNFMDQLEVTSDNINNGSTQFVDQFFRNNWNDYQYVKDLGDTKGLVIAKGKPMAVEITEGRNKNLVSKKAVKDESGNIIEPTKFVKFMTVTKGKNKYLFQLQESYGNKATYVRTEPLGIPNIIKEYNYNIPYLQSIFKEGSSVENEKPVEVVEVVEDKSNLPTQEELEEQKKHCKK